MADSARPPGPLTRLVRALSLVGLEGASAGFGCWSILSWSVAADYARANDLGPAQRRFALIDIGGGAIIALLLVAALAARTRRDAVSRVERVAHRFAPLVVLGAAPSLLDYRIWRGREVYFSCAVLACGAGLLVALRTSWATEPLVRWPERVRARVAAVGRRVGSWLDRVDLPSIAVVTGACVYAVYFSVITIVRHRNLGTHSFDLGLEDNLMWNLVHRTGFFRSTPFSGPDGGSHFANHVTFFSYLLAPIYALRPGPETLLVIQATLMGAAAVPLFLYARQSIPPWAAAIVAFLYLVYPPLHGANLYDFHYLPLGPLFLWLALYGIKTRRLALAAIAALLAMSVREDVSCCLAALGLFLLVSGEAPLEGIALAVLGGGYFLVLKLFVMPRFVAAGRESFLEQYAGLLPPGGSTMGGVLETMVGNPAFTGKVLLDGDKLQYVLQLLTPLLFLPLRYPVGLLLIGPGVLFTLMSTGYAPLTQISFQYTTYWTAFLFVALVVTWGRTARPRDASDAQAPRRLRASVMAVLAASLVCTSYDGAFTRHDTVRGGFEPFSFETTGPDLRRREELARLVAAIPSDARVAATERLVPHVSTRSDAYTLRFGSYDADYLLFEIPARSDEKSHVYPRLASGEFGVVEDLGDMALAKRGYGTEGNAAVLRR